MKKGHVISVRISDELGDKFDQVSKKIGLNKTEFITQCIKKIVNQNEFYIENYPRTKELIQNIKNCIKNVPKEYIKIINGKIIDINDITIYSFCDILFATSKKFWECIVEVVNKHPITVEGEDDDIFEEFKKEYLLDIEDVTFLMVPRTKQLLAENFIEDKYWQDPIETKKFILLLGAEKAFNKYKPEEIIKESLSEDEKEEQNVMIIDVKGRFTRSGDVLISPVIIESEDHYNCMMKEKENEK